MPPKSISAYFLGAIIPKDRLGEVMETLYLAEAGNLQIDPVFDKNAYSKKLESQMKLLAPTIEGEKGPELAGQKFRSGKGGRPSARRWILETIAKQPISASELRDLAEPAGYNRGQVSQMIVMLHEDGTLIQNGDMLSLGAGDMPAPPLETRAGKNGRMSARQWMIQQLSKGPVNNKLLLDRLEQAGYKRQLGHQAVFQLRGEGVVTRKGDMVALTKGPQAPAASTTKDRMPLRDFIISIVKKKGPMSRAAIVELARKAGYADRQVDPRLVDARKVKALAFKDGIYTYLRDAVGISTHKAAPIKPQSKARSQEDIILSALRRARRPTSLQVCARALEKEGQRPQSAGVAILSLTKKGLVKRVGPALYQYCGPPGRKSANLASDAPTPAPTAPDTSVTPEETQHGITVDQQ